jgi:hypothetical protein
MFSHSEATKERDRQLVTNNYQDLYILNIIIYVTNSKVIIETKTRLTNRCLTRFKACARFSK